MHMEPGRLFFSEIPRGIPERIKEMLQPIFSHINRDDHSERAAFLHMARVDDCDGWLRLYISHFPCISCVAVSCQFVRFFPAIRLQMDFDNMWKTRFPHSRMECKPDAWKVFDVQEGKVDEEFSA
eukprot:CAMPEP_0179150316 /NCGR_PEP_ID=MMETSP0796-20121207/72894_1 /TAXON_ID=73915 /ORGANISM="Pyrodinium bahamense, Strain pbaha01" /LENGTH=124 /DNA_ID=CAMNT_0020851277 /DNA_START=99 /DNA_END=473 /DNA_ORIENTATION=+